MTDTDQLKLAAAQVAADLVEPGMLVGLGSGSTARAFVDALGARVRKGLNISAVASSKLTARRAELKGIKLVPFDTALDLAVDGADAIELCSLAAIKGLGGALVRERLVAQSAARFILIADKSKAHSSLRNCPPTMPIPVEILTYGWNLTVQTLKQFGSPELRTTEGNIPFVSDNGNHIVDVYHWCQHPIEELASNMKALAGVVDHGIFLNLATEAIIASPGGIRRYSAGRCDLASK